MPEKEELENDKYYNKAKMLMRTEKSLAYNSIKEVIEFMHKWEEIRILFGAE